MGDTCRSSQCCHDLPPQKKNIMGQSWACQFQLAAQRKKKRNTKDPQEKMSWSSQCFRDWTSFQLPATWWPSVVYPELSLPSLPLPPLDRTSLPVTLAIRIVIFFSFRFFRPTIENRPRTDQGPSASPSAAPKTHRHTSSGTDWASQALRLFPFRTFFGTATKRGRFCKTLELHHHQDQDFQHCHWELLSQQSLQNKTCLLGFSTMFSWFSNHLFPKKTV